MAAASLPDKTDDGTYALLFGTFSRLLDRWTDSAERLTAFEELVELRVGSLVECLLDGLRIDLDRALEILRAKNDFATDRERRQRDILVAGLENMIDFAAAEEYAMLCELPANLEEEERPQYERIFRYYNGPTARQEDLDVRYAAAMAVWWIGISEESVLMFVTQGDERVRPWHASLEGVSYPKREFPAELIPPIEHGCRCYLTAAGFGVVSGVVREPLSEARIDPTFRESLCRGGRIFSAEHPYFRRPLPPALRQVVRRIKSKFHLP